jgi:hypothetical protein
MQIASAQQIAEVTAARTAKGNVRELIAGIPNTPDNYVLRYSTGADGEPWTTPRHRHPFDQVRYVIEGDYSIGTNAVLPTGWVGYFPESVYYGPQDMSPNLAMVVVQSGGPSGHGFYSAEQRLAANAALREAGGTFANGIYSWTDDAGRPHNRPAGDAVWEHLFGTAELPLARYRDIVLMNPASFSWVPDSDRDGVSHRRLGTFTERQLKVGFIRVAAGATWELGTAPAGEILFLVRGTAVHHGTEHPRLTAFATAATDPAELITATTECEFFALTLPRFPSATERPG